MNVSENEKHGTAIIDAEKFGGNHLSRGIGTEEHVTCWKETTKKKGE